MVQPQEKAAAFSWLRENSWFHYTCSSAGAITGFSFCTPAALTQHFPTLAPVWSLWWNVCTCVFEQVTSSHSGLVPALMLLRFQPHAMSCEGMWCVLETIPINHHPLLSRLLLQRWQSRILQKEDSIPPWPTSEKSLSKLLWKWVFPFLFPHFMVGRALEFALVSFLFCGF